MPIRWGPGPVFVRESILAARRWQVYAGRSFFVLVMLAGMTWIWVANIVALSLRHPGATPGAKEIAEVGSGFFLTLTSIQLTLVLLAAPAAAAASLGRGRARGTLLEMMVTDLSSAEIVLGTLAARLAPVVGLILCTVPVTAIAALLGGIDYAALAGALVVSLAVALVGCTLALTLSVWVTKMHEVVLAVTVAQAVCLLAAPIWAGLSSSGTLAVLPPDWFWKANPYMLALAPYIQPGYAGIADYALFTGAAVVFSALLVGLSIARLRPVAVRESGRPARADRWRWSAWRRNVFPSWTGPQLDGNPVLWREWHRNRPSRLARGLTTFLWSTMLGLAAWGTYKTVTLGQYEGSGGLEGSLALYVTLGQLMLCTTAPTTFSDERTDGSLDVLLATPLPTRGIVVAKWWGVYRRVLVVLPLFLYVAFFEATTAPDLPSWAYSTRVYPTIEPLSPLVRFLGASFCVADFLASGALLTSLGIVLAIWIRRPGTAVTVCVIVFVLIGLVWPIAVEMSHPLLMQLWKYSPGWTPNQVNAFHDALRRMVEILAGFSPVLGPMAPLNVFIFNAGKGTWYWSGLGVVIALKAAAAGLLLLLAICTFDRRFGRVAESGSPVEARGTAGKTEPGHEWQ